MIKSVIDIKDKWRIILFINVDYNRYDVIESALSDIIAPTHVIEDVYHKIGYVYNSGFTYTNPDYRTSVVGINKATSKEELINTLTHEADHVQTDVCEYYDIDVVSEDAAYLIGYIVEQFYKHCIKCFCEY